MTISSDDKLIESNAPPAPAAAEADSTHVHGPQCNHDHHHHHEAQQPFVRSNAKVGRNDPCSCGSNQKYKKCCGKSA